MPALRGSLTYASFFVEGELPESFHAPFLKAVRLRSMKPLEPDEDALERSGWCRIGEPFETDLGHDDIFYNEFLNVGFRTDRWVFPGPVVRAKLREAEAAYLAKKGRERLSKRERAELKELVTRKLRRQLAPATRTFDVSWALSDGIVRFFSQSPKVAGAMSDLFHRTFGLKLIPASPYTVAARLGLGKAEEKAWQELEMTELAEGA
jgi:DNA recombination-dependent growth factor C